MPEVSVIIPCYNQAEFLADALASVQQQSLTNWECIVVNDASTDYTAEKALTLSAADSRISVVTTPRNLGLAGARNFGIAQAAGIFVLPLDADDKIAGNYLQEAVSMFHQQPDTCVVYAGAEFFGAQSGQWELPPYHYGLLFGRNPIFCSALFKKEDWKKSGGYNETLISGLEDWDFWLKILEPDSRVVQLPFTGFYYRKHAQSMIGDLVNDKAAFEQTKADMLMRHRDKWLKWSFDYLAPQLAHMQFYKQREQQIASNRLGRWLYKLARSVSGSS